MLRLPHKTSQRCSKCCACHAKQGGFQKHHSSPDFCRPLWRCSECCACHAKRAGDAPSAAPATQNETAPKSITRRQTSADLYEGAPSAAPATQNEPEVLQVLRLPRKTSLRCSKCCACHAKRGGAQRHHSSPDFRRPQKGAPSAAPATQNEAAPKSITRRQISADLYEGAPSAALATQYEAAPNSITRRQTSADLYEGAPSAAPATQNEPEVLQVL